MKERIDIYANIGIDFYIELIKNETISRFVD